jgi:hypothetical protein
MRRLWVSLVSLALAGAAIGGGISVAAETDDPAPVSVLKVSPEFAANAGEALKAARPVAPAKTPTQAPAGPSRAELERTAAAHAGRLSASEARKLVAEHSPALTRPDVIVPKAEDIASIVGGNALREQGKPGVRISNFPIAIASVSNATRDGIQRKPGAGLEADARQLDSSGGDVVDLAPETTWKLVDLDLAVKGDRIAVDRPVVDVSLPATAGGVAQIGDLGLRLAPAGSDSAGVIADQSVVYPNVSTDTDLVARATSIGLAVGWSIRTPDASREVRMPLDLPGGVRPVVTRTGEVQLLDRNDRLFGNVSIATARDADNASVPVQMAVEGSTIVYRVEHAAGKVAYPITLDPTVSVDWRTTVPDPSDGWFSFSTPYGTTQPFLYSRNTQSSTQQGGLAIGAPASAAYALDAAGAWGRFAPGNPAVGTVQSPATGRKISPEHAWWYRFDAGAVNYLTIPTQWYHAYNNPYGTAAILNRDGLLMPSMWQGQSSGTGPTGAAYGPAQSGIPALTTATTGAGASVWIGTANTGAGVNPSDATDNTLTLSLQQPKLFYQNDHPATALAMGWYSAYTADNVAPQVTASSPSGWLGLTYTIPVSATDNGLGIKAFQLQAADGVPIGTPTTKDCVQTASKICEFTASADVPVEPAQEGIHTFKATATDAGGRTGTQNITLKIDKTPPSIDLGGSMYTQRGTRAQAGDRRTISVTATDGQILGGPGEQRAGVAWISVFVDGVQVSETDQTISGDSAGLTASWTVPDERFSTADHQIRVVTSDRLGHQSEASFFAGFDDQVPAAVTGLDATYDADVPETVVSWDDAADPDSSNNTAGSGVVAYKYRYRVGAAPWSSWALTGEAGFTPASIGNGTTLDVEVQPFDMASNAGTVTSATLTSAPSTATGENPGPDDGDIAGTPVDPEPDVLTALAAPGAPDPSVEPSAGGSTVSLDGSTATITSYSEHPCFSSPCGKYSPRDAVAYARKWNLLYSAARDQHEGTGDDYQRSNANPNYRYFGGAGGDCTNYVSQALKAGGLRFMRANGRNRPDSSPYDGTKDLYEKGEGSWWSNWWFYHDPISSLGDHRIYDNTESWARVQKLYDHLLEYGLADPVSNAANLRRGDLVFINFDGTDNDNLHHAQIITRVTHGRAYVSQHSPAYLKPLANVRIRVSNSSGTFGTDWKWFFLRPRHTAANIG